MKLISFELEGKVKFGAFEDNMIYDLHALDQKISDNMADFLNAGESQIQLAKNAINDNNPSISIEDVVLLSPVPSPPSVRDAYAFRQHVATARRNRGLDMIPEFDEIPIFSLPNFNKNFDKDNGIINNELNHKFQKDNKSVTEKTKDNILEITSKRNEKKIK